MPQNLLSIFAGRFGASLPSFWPLPATGPEEIYACSFAPAAIGVLRLEHLLSPEMRILFSLAD